MFFGKISSITKLIKMRNVAEHFLPPPPYSLPRSSSLETSSNERKLERQPHSHRYQGKEQRSLPLPLHPLLEQERLPYAKEMRLHFEQRSVVVRGENLLHSMRLIFRNRDGESRVVENVLEGERIAIDYKGGNTPGVDCFERPRRPARKPKSASSTKWGEGRLTKQGFLAEADRTWPN